VAARKARGRCWTERVRKGTLELPPEILNTVKEPQPAARDPAQPPRRRATKETMIAPPSRRLGKYEIRQNWGAAAWRTCTWRRIPGRAAR